MDKLGKLAFLVLLLQPWPALGKATNSAKRDPRKRLCFSVFGDFGGLPRPPYTTWMQRKVAAEMAKVCVFS